jgi:hypothetical protein
MKATPTNTSNRGTSNYGRSAPGGGSHSYAIGHTGNSRAGVDVGKLGDDEIQLVLQGSRKNSLSPTTRTVSDVGTQDGKDTVKITTDVAILREAI